MFQTTFPSLTVTLVPSRLRRRFNPSAGESSLPLPTPISWRSDGQRSRVRCEHLPVQESLMHIEPVQIRGPRAALASVLQSALKFAEESDAGAEMKVRRQQVSLEKVSVAVRRSTTEVG